MAQLEKNCLCFTGSIKALYHPSRNGQEPGRTSKKNVEHRLDMLVKISRIICIPLSCQRFCTLAHMSSRLSFSASSLLYLALLLLACLQNFAEAFSLKSHHFFPVELIGTGCVVWYKRKGWDVGLTSPGG